MLVFERSFRGRLRKRKIKYVKPLAWPPLSQTMVCDKPAKATGMAREIKALLFSKIVLEILFLIAYHLNEFR